MNCATCKRDIHVGEDCYQGSKGVVGSRENFVDLAHWIYCSVECLENGLDKIEANGKDDDDELPWFERRTP
jgi:hypothetical protein